MLAGLNQYGESSKKVSQKSSKFTIDTEIRKHLEVLNGDEVVEDINDDEVE